jgi:tRNA (mo5U34)-methyltransferase
VDTEELKKEVAKISWYHTIDLGHGVVTPGTDNSPARLRKLALHEDLRGSTVLDIGAWDGFFSFEAERRGASRVLATDSFCWGGGGPGTKDGFELARKTLNSKVEDMNVDVLELSPEIVGVFDLVLFLGVLYHMRHPPSSSSPPLTSVLCANCKSSMTGEGGSALTMFVISSQTGRLW